MTDISAATTRVDKIQSDYLDQIHRKRLYSGILLAVFILLMISGFVVADNRNAGGFWDGLHNLFDFPVEVLSEAAQKWARLPANLAKHFPSLIETLNIAAAATLLGTMLAIILSLLSSRGLTRWPRLIVVVRRCMDVMRAVPEIVVALILIYVLGGGPVPAMIAIAVHTSGALGKLFSEVNENVSLKPVEGLQSVGATWLQQMWLGVLPQVSPNYLSYALLRFEINIRASAILGFVGAGGIGYELRNTMTWGQGKYDEAAAIFLLLFGAIVFFDQLSGYFRNRLTKGAQK